MLYLKIFVSGGRQRVPELQEVSVGEIQIFLDSWYCLNLYMRTFFPYGVSLCLEYIIYLLRLEFQKTYCDGCFVFNIF